MMVSPGERIPLFSAPARQDDAHRHPELHEHRDRAVRADVRGADADGAS